MSDPLYAGRRFRTVNGIDDSNREPLHVEIDTSITGKRLINIFEQLQQERGLPDILRADNRPEFLSGEFIAWAEESGIMIRYIQPENQTRMFISRGSTAHIEINCVTCSLFRNLNGVREATYWWK